MPRGPNGEKRPSGQRSPTRAALPDLLDGVDRANHAAAELGLSAVRSASAAGDWRASAWFLEHRFPDSWGRMERAADTQADTSADAAWLMDYLRPLPDRATTRST